MSKFNFKDFFKECCKAFLSIVVIFIISVVVSFVVTILGVIFGGFGLVLITIVILFFCRSYSDNQEQR